MRRQLLRFYHSFFDWLHEVRALAGSRQLFSFFVGFLFFAELIQRDALQRLVKHSPKRLHPHFFGAFSTALTFGGFLFGGGRFLRGALGLSFSSFDFGAFILATNNFGHIPTRGQGFDKRGGQTSKLLSYPIRCRATTGSARAKTLSGRLVERYMQLICSCPKPRLKIHNRPILVAIANRVGSLPCPKKGLVDEALRQSAGVHFVRHIIAKINLRL